MPKKPIDKFKRACFEKDTDTVIYVLKKIESDSDRRERFYDLLKNSDNSEILEIVKEIYKYINDPLKIRHIGSDTVIIYQIVLYLCYTHNEELIAFMMTQITEISLWFYASCEVGFENIARALVSDTRCDAQQGLIIASRYGRSNIIKIIIESKRRINVHKATNEAFINGQIEASKELLLTIGPLSLVIISSEILINACKHGQYVLVEEIVKECRTENDFCDYCFINGHLSVFKAFRNSCFTNVYKFENALENEMYHTVEYLKKRYNYKIIGYFRDEYNDYLLKFKYLSRVLDQKIIIEIKDAM